ncbi:cytochrome P450 [Aspergillus aculeatinus CBS 121060]|uniref:Cytochrome P450 n=1 Tax=Aspergillus aculeatinus CBS 121060 TaxID=1448322 RepID=A0ACD1H2H8_9EURO|nr:cytochrome P450 [Aspergillus aculeatinus CBS 121060]RAH67593.1 cytochrome P450 [Aspergillus aculeatinus CBS 121060]
MSSLIRESEVTRHSNRKPLTIHEILAENMYVIKFAGHDTAANTMTYLMFLLAAYLDIQDWIAEEIQTVIPKTDQGNAGYKEACPRLKRCLAVLDLPKCVAPAETTLHLPESNRTLVLPHGAVILPSLLAVQTHPRYWPDEPQAWHPPRWIQTLDKEQLAREKTIEPRAGTSIPLSAGVQVCAGRDCGGLGFPLPRTSAPGRAARGRGLYGGAEAACGQDFGYASAAGDSDAGSG